jgi:hypothetical protein
MKCAGITLLIMMILPLIALIAFLMQSIDTLAATNTTIIQVNISEVAQIQVSPDYLDWSQIAPGANGTLRNITVTNTGSKTFSNGIYISVFDNATTNPTDNDLAYDYVSGTFLVAGNSTDLGNEAWWFVNQISWNESTYPSPTSPTAGADSWGWYHNTSSKWMWELVGNGSNYCNRGGDDGVTLKVQPTAGSASLGGATSATYSANNTYWSVWNISSGPLQQYCIAAHVSCNYIMIYRWDKNSSLPTGCFPPKLDYILPGSLAPSAEKRFWVKPHIPSGIVSGTAQNSTITITAE